MPSTGQSSLPSTTQLWTGRVISGVVILMLVFSGVLKLMKPDQVVEEFARLGYDDHIAFGLGILELTCAAIYAIPKTAVLGAILVTGYLGGATATHVRISDPFLPPVIAGVLAWLGLYLRDTRLRSLIPLRQSSHLTP
jgi:hypothetical protein